MHRNLLQVITDLRSNLDFNSTLTPDKGASTPNTTRRQSSVRPTSDRGSEALTLDAIRSGIRFQKCIAEAWIKVPIYFLSATIADIEMLGGVTAFY